MFKSVSNEPLSLNADPYLRPYAGVLERRRAELGVTRRRLTGGGSCRLADFASAHEYYGLHFRHGEWVFREWAPHAEKIFITGDFSGWKDLPEFALRRLNSHGDWELKLPAAVLGHGMLYKLRMGFDGTIEDRIPAYARYVVQDEVSKIFCAEVWRPEHAYRFCHESPARPAAQLIYEAHVGMAHEEYGVGTFREFQQNVLPRIKKEGYNTVQLMAVMNHPYYGSFGYHVANFFSIAGRFGTPDEFKELVDTAHGMGLRIIIDLVHSHAVKNAVEGLAEFDGTRYAYFHAGERGEHRQWDSLCFNYGKDEVLHFLLSNCRFYLDEYHVDGFRFDGVTSMLYRHHGLGKAFTSYADYFGADVDDEALVYLTLANEVVHQVRPDAVTVAEDVSGMPGLAAADGVGFDCRMAMGVSDMWFKLFDVADEEWDMNYLYSELVNRRADERTVSYVECHDQAIVGGQSVFFRLAGAEIYDGMAVDRANAAIDRAMALHKISRLATLAGAGHGYLNFMGNEFGHPEWVDFPREGNNWSYHYARRQWSLADNGLLRYHFLGDFDRAMVELGRADDCALFRSVPQKMRVDNMRKIIIFERNGLLFCFNFHPVQSVRDYAFEAPPGEYELILNSDDVRFGGFGFVADGARYHSHRLAFAHGLEIYLPCRSALVLRRVKGGRRSAGVDGVR